jgi:hypothetical protein
MINSDDVPDVEDDEMLARFIVAGQSTRSLRKYVRENNTVKPQLFLPYKRVELSVNRHRDCDEGEIWDFGQAIAAYREMAFYGRSDIAVVSCTFDKLSVVAKPIRNHPQGVPDNPNHADIVDFPAAKEDQLSLAEKLAAKATDRQAPPDSE